MNLKWFVTFIAINVVSCIKSIQKIPPKYNTPSNPDQTSTLPLDKNSFPEVVYPTNIFDIADPFYFNSDNNYEVLEPFSEDVKSSYKLLSSITKPLYINSERNVKYQTERTEIVTTPATDAATNVTVVDAAVEENITEYHNDSKEICINAIVLAKAIETENNTDSIFSNMAQNYDDYNVSMSQEVRNESCPKTPLLFKINIQVFRKHSDKSNEVMEVTNNNISLGDEHNITHLKQATDKYLTNESGGEINSSSEEHYTELQDFRLTTLIENEASESIVFESLDNITNSGCLGLMESDLTDSTTNITHSDLESMLNLTEQVGHSDDKSIKNSKEDYFLDLLVSLDSLCENNNTVNTVADTI